MQKINNEDIKLNNTIITLGKFDGNHIGHQSLFKKAKEIKAASKEPLSTVIFTFDINPKKVVSGKEVETLYTSAERASLEGEGMDYIYIWPFTKENMAMEPEDFVRSLLYERLGVRHIVVGEDFRFGRQRRGDVALLKSMESECSFKVHAMEKVTYKGLEVSSTRIKEEILKGNLSDANLMLGNAFSVIGKVVGGKHLGKSLGFPTINFEAPKGKILPPNGVYASRTTICKKTYISMSNIGTRPTFEQEAARNIETNIFDFNEDVYGVSARVEFFSFIRPEQHFESSAALIEEIKKNQMQVKEYFEKLNQA